MSQAKVGLTVFQQQLLSRFQADLASLELELSGLRRVIQTKLTDQQLWVTTLVKEAGAPVGNYSVQTDSDGVMSLLQEITNADSN